MRGLVPTLQALGADVEMLAEQQRALARHHRGHSGGGRICGHCWAS